MGELLRLEEIALKVGVSFKTINNWYAFKKACPDNEYAQMLPDFIQDGVRQTRYWTNEAVEALIKFKEAIPIGRNGVMGEVTQKYLRKDKQEDGENATKNS